jgi:hypothetical protein
MRDFFRVFHHMFHIIVFTKELRPGKILPFFLAPVVVKGGGVVLSHKEQGEISNLLDDFIWKSVNFLMQSVSQNDRVHGSTSVMLILLRFGGISEWWRIPEIKALLLEVQRVANLFVQDGVEVFQAIIIT